MNPKKGIPRYRHGACGTREHVAWRSLRQRCWDKNCKDYPRYGGRGITVDPAFDGPNGFATFLKEVGPKPGKEYSLDRKDNEKGYVIGNIKWSTKSEQNFNRRPPRKYVRKKKK